MRKKKVLQLENEIHFFVAYTKTALASDNSIVHAIEGYIEIATPTMQSELGKLLVDMKSSGAKQALMRFDSRMNSPEISCLCTALIDLEQGADTTQTLSTLSANIAEIRCTLIERKLSRSERNAEIASILPVVIFGALIALYMLVNSKLLPCSNKSAIQEAGNAVVEAKTTCACEMEKQKTIIYILAAETQAEQCSTANV